MTNNQVCNLVCAVGAIATWLFLLCGMFGATWSIIPAFISISITIIGASEYEP